MTEGTDVARGEEKPGLFVYDLRTQTHTHANTHMYTYSLIAIIIINWKMYLKKKR